MEELNNLTPHCLVYSNADELVDKTKWAISHPREVNRISHNGFKLSQNHTYKSRVKSLLQILH